MPKFQVRLSGTNLRLRILRRKWFFRDEERVQFAEMITTRFVEAESANEAIEKAVELVKAELQN